MTIQEIAAKLIDLCRQNKYEEAQTQLYADDAESIEPPHSKGLKSVKGIDAIKEKGKQFQTMLTEIYATTVSDPVIAGKRFAIAMGMDVGVKGRGRTLMEEIAVYEVKDGKIVKEEFIY